MNQESKFYRMFQSRKRTFYYPLLFIPIFFFLLLTGLIVLLIYDLADGGMSLDDIMSVILMFGVNYLIIGALFAFLHFKYHQAKKQILGNYETLSWQSKQLMEMELNGIHKISGILFGEEGLYFYDRKFMGFPNFITYDRISWCFVKTMQSSISLRPDLAMPGSIKQLGLITIYTSDGIRHIVNDSKIQYETFAYLEEIGKKAPRSRYGYTKEHRQWWKESFHE